jgi:hypothetical protein
VIGLLGLAWPGLVRPIFVGWVVLVFPLGRAVSYLTLMILYFGIITPTGLLCRLLGRDALRLRRRPEQLSYWTPQPVVDEPGRYLRPF